MLWDICCGIQDIPSRIAVFPLTRVRIFEVVTGKFGTIL